EPPDALGEKGDLRLGRARVGLVDPELGQDGLLLLGGQRHVSLLVVPVRVDTWPRRRGPQEGRSTTIPAGSSDERIAAGSAPEYRPCPPHVAPHRVEELVDGGELLHVADVVHEVDGGPTAVQIRGLVQDERLDATGTVPEGRVGP